MKNFIRKLVGQNPAIERIVYICYLLYEQLRKLFFLFARIHPIDNKKIVICAMQGTRYGDNPFYISEILRNSGNDYEIVWLLNPNVKEELPKGIRRADYSNIFESTKELATAKVWIDSNTKLSGFLKRKGQLYVQTWHGSYGLKKIGMDLGKNLPLIDRRNFLYNSKNEDIMVSNSRRTSEIYRDAFGYKGNIIEKGSPRNDMLLSNAEDYSEKVRSYFGLSEDKKLVLYAPTFRNDYRTDSMKLDFERLISDLEKKFSGEWVVLVRLHYKNLEDAKEFIEYSDRIINATDYGVMQELLAVVDVLITDYSSCMFDFATTEKPCFIYASDLEKYDKERGNYYSMEELPFPLATNNDELENVIGNYDKVSYINSLHELFDKVGLNETGKASEAVADYIIAWMNK